MAHNGDGRLRQSFGGVLAANRGVVFCWRFDVIRGIVIRAGESYKGHMAHLQSHLQRKVFTYSYVNFVVAYDVIILYVE